MTFLEQTHNTMGDLAGDRQRNFGEHISSVPRANAFGINLGEVTFDPARHELQDINPFSMAEESTGMPHVRMVLPRRALDIQIVEDRTDNGDDPQISRAKHRLAEILGESIIHSKSGITDRVKHYLIVDSDQVKSQKLGYDVELIDSSKGAEAVSRTVADICLNGLTFVISDFKSLRLENQSRHNYEKTVAIKINHPAEIEIPAGNVIFELGKGRELDSSKPKELAKFNLILEEKNRIIIERLENAGVSVAQVIFKPVRPDNKLEYNLANADTAIAKAINRISLH